MIREFLKKITPENLKGNKEATVVVVTCVGVCGVTYGVGKVVQYAYEAITKL
jgi:hypothetical protein